MSPNVTYSQGSNFQYTQPFIQHPSPGSGRSTFYPPIPFSCYAFGVNQQHQEMTNDPNIRQYVSQHAVDMNNMIVRRIRDILIEILNSAMCEVRIVLRDKKNCDKEQLLSYH